MKDLFSFLNNASDTSDFKAKLSERGGFITFSNSGRRGGIKFFQILSLIHISEPTRH